MCLANAFLKTIELGQGSIDFEILAWETIRSPGDLRILLYPGSLVGTSNAAVLGNTCSGGSPGFG